MQQQGAQQRFQRREAAQSPHRSAASAQLLPRGRKESNQYAPIFQLRHASSLEWPWSNVNRYLSAYGGSPTLESLESASYASFRSQNLHSKGSYSRAKLFRPPRASWVEAQLMSPVYVAHPV